jgi:hypothetical protein
VRCQRSEPRREGHRIAGISTRLRRPRAPGSSATAARRTANAAASASTQAAFARPSTGGALTATRSASPCAPPTRSRFAPGET